MQIKLKRPTNLEEVKEYERQIEKLMLAMLIKKFKERGIPVTIKKNTKKEDKLASEMLYTFNASDFPYELPALEPTLENIVQSYKQGSPSIFSLPPLTFMSSKDKKATIPYLKVRAVSWLSTESHKHLYHELLTFINEDHQK